MILRATYTAILFLFLCFSAHARKAETSVSEDRPVVIMTSYNPDVKSISDNVTAFTKRFNERGCSNPIVLESLHALNLSESVQWQDRMWALLSKYYADEKGPAAIVLLGNEAVSTFFSIEREEFRQTPVVIGMRGDNMVKVTDDTTIDLSNWLPESHLLSRDFPDYNIVGGLLYSYDVQKTVAILDQVPRQIDTLAFISDNTFGGITMLSYFKSQSAKLAKYGIKYLDGRKYDFSTLNYELAGLDEHSAVVIGTWRIDSSDSYALSNTTYTLAYANVTVPAVTLANVGLGHWAIGGYNPQYRLQGAELADYVVDYFKTGVAKKPTLIPSRYNFDNDKLTAFGIDPHEITDDYILLNQEKGFIRENLGVILSVTALVAFLVGCLIIAIRSLIKSRRLQKQLQEQLEAVRKANNANDAKTSFLFNMSHDIRTPMNAIIGFTDLLKKHQEEPERRQDYLRKIRNSSNVLLSIINNVLEMARIEKGTIVIEEKAWHAERFNESLHTIFQEMMERKGLTFNHEIDVQHPWVLCDPTKLREVFYNILSNAYKYTHKGSVTMKIKELPYDREGYALYQTTITDTGIGMSKDFLPHLFEEFSRENNTTDNKIEGTGLGMPIVKRLVELMQGTIEVRSQQGVGTTFIVTFPHKIANESEAEEIINAESTPVNYEGKRILLAEDNDLNAEIAMEILNEVGFILERAEDGQRAVEMVDQADAGHYDIILMDIQMPTMNGYEATKAIRQMADVKKATIPILAMTANAFEEDKRNAFAAGMNGHLAKPIDVTELMKALSKHLK